MKFLTTLLILAGCSSASASGINPSHAAATMVAETYVLNNIHTDADSDLSVAAMSLDPRINIPDCPMPMEANSSAISMKQSNVTVRVSCPTNKWFIYMVVKVTETQKVLVLSDSLSPGTVLTKNNVKLVDIDKKRIRGTTFSHIDDIVGARVKRRIRAGQQVSPGLLCFVCKGDAIVINASVAGLSIKTTGIAQEDGNIGDTILVKNRKSKKVIDAQVVSIKNVKVHI